MENQRNKIVKKLNYKKMKEIIILNDKLSEIIDLNDIIKLIDESADINNFADVEKAFYIEQ